MRKYTLYAIGEIALVVIGILIALQINNWSEWRKDQLKEKIILQEISETIKENILTLEWVLEHLKHSNNSSLVVLRFLNDSLSYSDTLTFHFDRAQWSSTGLLDELTDAGYIGLTNAGFGILSSADIKNNIIRYFSKDLPRLKSLFYTKNEIHSNYDEYIRRNFRDLGGPNSKPIDNEKIRKDNFYHSIIMTIYDTRKSFLRNTGEFYSKSKALLKQITDHLNED
jgi:hypothetical protein